MVCTVRVIPNDSFVLAVDNRNGDCADKHIVDELGDM